MFCLINITLAKLFHLQLQKLIIRPFTGIQYTCLQCTVDLAAAHNLDIGSQLTPGIYIQGIVRHTDYQTGCIGAIPLKLCRSHGISWITQSNAADQNMILGQLGLKAVKISAVDNGFQMIRTL